MSKEIIPKKIRLETSSVCQLRCHSCPNTSKAILPTVGNGFLRLKNFQELLNENPSIAEIELSNYGEIFLNPDLLEIIKYAYEREITLTANNGVNLNNVKREVLEGLIQYKFRSMTISIDGTSNGTYKRYRVGGNYEVVIENIKKINLFKKQYQSKYPLLSWQFIVFGYNEHELPIAKKMAGELYMNFCSKLSWDSEFSPIQNQEVIRKELSAVSRVEYKEKYGVAYAQGICHQLWEQPQINWDGKVLGCSRNFWGDFGGNVFTDGLFDSLNNEKINYARDMLMGRQEARDDIPCATCEIYLDMREKGSWLKRGFKRRLISLMKKIAKYNHCNINYKILKHRLFLIKLLLGKVRRGLTIPMSRAKFYGKAIVLAKSVYMHLGKSGKTWPPASGIYPLYIPLPPDEKKGFKPYHIFYKDTMEVSMESHVSVLTKGSSPHSPHAHDEEEILVLLAGEVDLILPDLKSAKSESRLQLKANQCVYYPIGFSHTLLTVSETPANYLMFRWKRNFTRSGSAIPFGLYNIIDSSRMSIAEGGFHPKLLFQGPTKYLQKLRCHTSTLAPGAGYKPHSDPYCVSIIVLEGEVETLGKRVRPYGVIYYGVGEPHGMYNPGEVTARYVVFEFHG